MIVQSQLSGLQSNLAAIDKVQNQVSSGNNYQEASDNPTANNDIMTSASALRALTQYQQNVSSATDRVNTEDSTLQQLTTLLTSAQQLAVQQGSANADPSTRQAAAADAAGLLQSAAQLGNTKFGDQYLFGGTQSEAAPFSVSGSGGSLSYSYTGSIGGQSIQVGAGETMTVTHDGSQVFVGTGVMDALQNLATSLANGDVAGINSASAAITDAVNNVQGVVGDVGARETELQTTSSNLSAYQSNLTNLKSNLQNVDVESAVTNLVAQQNAYQAAMLATSKVLSMSLTDYLQ
jgi:flagellar hook-associated protein 3 FlgL